MKTKIYKASGLLLIVWLLISCKKDFLEIVPKGKLIATTVKDYDLLMNNSSLYSLNSDNGLLIMGDDVAAEQSRFQNANVANQRAFAWEDVIRDPGQEDSYTNFQLKNLFICNKVINEVTTITDGTDAERAALQGDALATRAWINFDLINRYAKPYNATTAATDPGFPLITQANINAGNYSRNPVAEVYQSIIADLQKAIASLPAKSVFVTRMSRPAAATLLGKVYLFMGRPQEALTQLNLAFADVIATPSIASLYNYNETFAPGGEFLPIGRLGPNHPGSNILKYKESILLKTLNVYPDASGLVIKPEVMALYNASDLRLNFYSNTRSDMTQVPGGLKVKYAVQYAHIGIELSDLILLRAEVKARLNDLPGAKADVEMLRRNRMPAIDAPVPTTVITGPDLVKFIIEERQREYACEGPRWLDMRRLSVDPLHAVQNIIHPLYTADGTTISRTFTLRPTRLTLRIPDNILQLNPAITDNP